MAVEKFEICLNSKSKIYFPGEVLEGEIRISIKDRLRINNINLLILGDTKVNWVEYISNVSNNRLAHFKSREEYINKSVTFISKSNDSNDFYFEIGDYVYPFTFNLPENLPSSFEYKFARTRYQITCIIDIPWAFDKINTVIFTIINQLDLNKQLDLKMPISTSGTKILCCGLCSSFPITVHFLIFKGGYVAGESIFFKITIDNKSSREIKELVLSLIQEIKLSANNKTKVFRREVVSIQKGSKIKGNCLESWNSNLKIFPVCPTSDSTCSKIIEISYSIFLNFDASCLSLSTDLVLPIKIGTLPFNDSSADQTQVVRTIRCLYDADSIDFDNTFQTEIFDADEESFKPNYPYYEFEEIEDIE